MFFVKNKKFFFQFFQKMSIEIYTFFFFKRIVPFLFENSKRKFETFEMNFSGEIKKKFENVNKKNEKA